MDTGRTVGTLARDASIHVETVRSPAEGATCRLYEEDGRLARAPSVDRIVARLRGAVT